MSKVTKRKQMQASFFSLSGILAVSTKFVLEQSYITIKDKQKGIN